MELALNNFEVLNQSEMEDVDGGWSPAGAALTVGGTILCVVGNCTNNKKMQNIGAVAICVRKFS